MSLQVEVETPKGGSDNSPQPYKVHLRTNVTDEEPKQPLINRGKRVQFVKTNRVKHYKPNRNVFKDKSGVKGKTLEVLTPVASIYVKGPDDSQLEAIKKKFPTAIIRLVNSRFLNLDNLGFVEDRPLGTMFFRDNQPEWNIGRMRNNFIFPKFVPVIRAK
ncbi:uncharacterized protein [Periplaneta americana]|uniref:uncharacterized protein n=1 Tax=Periplaneta americana TaxID=6978 RepID=UPI0037E9AC2D